jgi:LPS sulfotransferase NodH
VQERESDIDWANVRKVLSSIQNRFNKAMVFKNIFGSYHLKKMHELLGKVIYVYIERDELDVAVSILKARQKYYDDLNTWWSYSPPEYDILKELPYMEQIAGQIYYLKKFYNNQIKSLESPVVVNVKYESVCKNPAGVLNEIQKLAGDVYNCDLKIINTPPEFEFRVYSDHDEVKSEFKQLIEEFRKLDSK